MTRDRRVTAIAATVGAAGAIGLAVALSAVELHAVRSLPADAATSRTPPIPTPGPARPASASVEHNGIRVTLEVDDTVIAYGERSWAHVTVKNIGPDNVYWQAGGCAFAAHVAARPPRPIVLDNGRRWAGEPGVLKSTTVGEEPSTRVAEVHFTPAEWVDRIGNFGCTTNSVIGTVPPGAQLQYAAAWDAELVHEMPASPGPYTAVATFSYFGRGKAPPMTDTGPMSNVVTEVEMEVRGPAVAWVTPGQAVDAAFSDGRYQALLTESPRSRWLGSDVWFENERWRFELRLGQPDQTLAAVIHALTGAVLAVELRPGQDPNSGH